MARRAILGALARLTGVFLLVSILFRVLAAFNVKIEGQVYSDMAFFTLLILTILGYSLHYSGVFRVARYPRLVFSLVLASGALILASVLFPDLPFGVTRSMLFWLGVAAAGAVVIIASIKLGEFFELEKGWLDDWKRGWKWDLPEGWSWKRGWMDLEEYAECANEGKELPAVELADPLVNRDAPVRIRTYGVRVKAQPGSVVYPSKAGDAVAVAGSGRFKSAGGVYGFDGLLLVQSGCPVNVDGRGAAQAEERDARELEFAGLQELRATIMKEFEQARGDIPSVVKEASGVQPASLEKAAREVDLGVVRVREGVEGKEVHLPGIHVVERPGAKYVEVGPIKVVGGKDRREEEKLAAFGVFDASSRPVTLVRSLGAVKRTVLVGERWVVKRKENGEG